MKIQGTSTLSKENVPCPRCRSYERICCCGTNWGAMTDRLNARTTASTPKYENKTSFSTWAATSHPVLNYYKSYSNSKGCGNNKNKFQARSTIPALPSLSTKYSTKPTYNMDDSFANQSFNSHNLLCNADAGQISLFMNNLESDLGGSCAPTDSSMSGYCESLHSGFSDTSTLKCDAGSSAFGCHESGFAEASTSACHESSNDTSTSSCYDSSTACADSSTSCCDSSDY